MRGVKKASKCQNCIANRGQRLATIDGAAIQNRLLVVIIFEENIRGCGGGPKIGGEPFLACETASKPKRN